MTLNLDNVTSYRYMHKGNIWNMRLLYMFWGWHAAKNVLIIRWIIMSIFCVKNVLCFVNESFDPLSNPLPLPLPPRLVCLCSGRTLPLGVYACGPHWCSLFILLFKRKPLSMAVWSLTGFLISTSSDKWIRALYPNLGAKSSNECNSRHFVFYLS